MKTLQEIKEEVYDLNYDKNGEMWIPSRQKFREMDNEAAELYAEQKAKEAFEAAREKLNHPDWDYIYDNYEQYKTKL